MPNGYISKCMLTHYLHTSESPTHYMEYSKRYHYICLYDDDDDDDDVKTKWFINKRKTN
jgi:hypothetical protein